MKHSLCALLLAIFCASTAQAQTFVVSTDRGEVLCGLSGTSWVSGKLSQGVFVSYTAQLKSLKRSLKKARGSKKTKIQKSIKSAQTALSRTKEVCREGPPESIPTNSNFDMSGSVTDSGKVLFGIPSNLSGTISLGRTLHQAQCAGCHGEKLGRTFSQYRSLISNSPMLFSSAEISDQALADLTAYLNRFRQ